MRLIYYRMLVYIECRSPPRLDLQENPDTNVVTAKFELPGIKRDDVNIDIQNDRLSVSGKTSADETREEGNYVVRERTYGEFSRTLSLSPGTKVCVRSWAEIGVLLTLHLKPEDVKANMENGVLTVTFPKATAEQLPKRIAID